MLKLTDIIYSTQLVGPLNVICDPHVPSFCLLPYQNHPKGCPNYGKKFNRSALCPPNAPFYFDIYKPKAYFGILILDFAAYLQMIKNRHPHWSEIQLKNNLYWQSHFRKKLKIFMLQQQPLYPGYEIIDSPETLGVHVFATLIKAGFTPEIQPHKKIHLVSFLSDRI